MSTDRKFSPPYVFGKDFLDLSWQDQRIYQAEAMDWVRENGIDPEDLEASRKFIDQFRPPLEFKAPDPDDDREWDFKPPFKGPFEVDCEFYRLPKAGRIAYMNAEMDWIDKQAELYAFRNQPKDFGVCTPETMSDFIDDDRDEITPEMHEKLKQDVLDGKVPGYVGEDGTLYLGDSSRPNQAKESDSDES